MSKTRISVPTLVSRSMLYGSKHYRLRPLFLPFPEFFHRRYNSALEGYKRQLKASLKHFSEDAPFAEALLWLLFTPKVTHRRLALQMTLKQQFVKGAFTVVSFKLQGKTFVCLPKLNNHIYMAGSAPNLSLEEECEKVIKSLMADLKEREGADFDASAYFAERGEGVFNMEIEAVLPVKPPKPKEEEDMSRFFSRLFDAQSFEGEEELEKTAQNLSEHYPASLDRAYLQEERVERLKHLLYDSDPVPLALIGPEGVGKHTVLQEAIWRYESERQAALAEAEELEARHKQVWHLDPTRLISGMSIVGAWQQRLEAIIAHIRGPSQEAKDGEVLMVDNPMALLSIGKSAQNSMTVSDLLRPYLEKRQLRLLIIATDQEWKAVQEKGRRFSSIFQVMRMVPPSLEEAHRIVLAKRRQLERKHEVRIQIQAARQVLDLQRNYLRQQVLPGGAIKVLQQLAIKHRYGKVDLPEVRAGFSALSGLQEHIFDPEQGVDAREVEARIGQSLIGQPQAVRALANVVQLMRAKLVKPDQPIASLLFIGPTGVGKTQAAKVLCEYLMGDEQQLLRFDMNEYLDPYSVQRLLGDEHRPEGLLTGAVRYRPFSIVLLDEIEKAHFLVHDLLLQLLDDGRLTDSLGRTVDFTNTIIIMTSNVGAQEAGHQVGYGRSEKDLSHAYQRALRYSFRPEFLNRIDQVISFQALEASHIRSIARLQIKALLRRDGFMRRTTLLNISEPALDWVAARGFDPKMGGRALKRQIERDLTALSAEQLIEQPMHTPLLMDIVLEGEQLRPYITPMAFAPPLAEEWMPDWPQPQEGYDFYLQLLERLEQLREDLEEAEEANRAGPIVFGGDQASRGTNWEYYHIKTKIEEERESLSGLSLGFRNRYYVAPPVAPLRLKLLNHFGKRGQVGLLAQEAAPSWEEDLQEIRSAYPYVDVQFDSLRTEFVNSFLKVAVLGLQQQALLDKAVNPAKLRFRSRVEGIGQREMAFLMGKYSKLLQWLDLAHSLKPDEHSIELEACGLPQLLDGEQGIHLFYTASGQAIPVEVSLSVPEDEMAAGRRLEVLRLYDAGHTLTDLRTGLSNMMDIHPQELLLLIYAGLPASLRAALKTL